MPVDALLYGTVVVYLAFMFLIGLLSGRRIRSAEDFLLAGRRLGVILLILTLAAPTLVAEW